MLLSNLLAAERGVYSQNGEDGVIESLFLQLGVTNKFLVEFGCGDGLQCNGAYLVEQGWTGLFMDGQCDSKNPRIEIRQEFITAKNINDLFRKYQVPEQFDLLSIDIDGNDFWVWHQIEARPRVVVIEYNGGIPPHQRRTIAYDPNFFWDGSDYHGASLAALAELGRRKGYTLVYCEQAGVNAFFVADALLPPSYRPRPIEELYRPPNYGLQGQRHAHNEQRQMIDPFADPRGPLLEFDEAAEMLAQGTSYLRLEQFLEAERAFRRVLELDPTNDEAGYQLGLTYCRLGRQEEALSLLQRAAGRRPHHAEAQYNLGVVLADAGRLEQAIACFERALRLRPDSALISGNLRYARAVRDNALGMTLARQGQFDEAVICFRRALESDPTFIPALGNLGNALTRQGKLAEAADCYRKVLEQSPNSQEARFNLDAILRLQPGLE